MDPRKTYRKAANVYLSQRGGNLIAKNTRVDADPDGPFEWSDAWLVLATRSAAFRDWAELDEIFAIGDAINHAIFTDRELEGGFARLEAAGLVEVDGARCRMTPAFEQAWREARGEGGSLSRQWKAAEKLLAAVRPARDTPPS